MILFCIKKSSRYGNRLFSEILFGETEKKRKENKHDIHWIHNNYSKKRKWKMYLLYRIYYYYNEKKLKEKNAVSYDRQKNHK